MSDPAASPTPAQAPAQDASAAGTAVGPSPEAEAPGSDGPPKGLPWRDLLDWRKHKTIYVLAVVFLGWTLFMVTKLMALRDTVRAGRDANTVNPFKRAR